MVVSLRRRGVGSETARAGRLSVIGKPLTEGVLVCSVPLVFSGLLRMFFGVASITIIKGFTNTETLNSINSAAVVVALAANVLLNVKNNIGTIATLRVKTRSCQEIRGAIRASIVLYFVTKLLLLITNLIFSGPLLRIVGAGPRLVSNTATCLVVCLYNSPTLTLCGFNGNILDTIKSAGEPLVCLDVSKVVGVILGLFFMVMYELKIVKMTVTDVVTRCVSTTLVVEFLLGACNDCNLHVGSVKVSESTTTTILQVKIPTTVRCSLFTVTGVYVRASVGSFDRIMIRNGSTTAGTSSLVCSVVTTFCATYADFVTRGLNTEGGREILDAFFVALTCSFLVKLILKITLFVFREPFLLLFADSSTIVRCKRVEVNIVTFICYMSTFVSGTATTTENVKGDMTPAVVIIVNSIMFEVV